MKIIIPTKYREKLGSKVVAIRGVDGCIFLFTEKYWESLMSKIENAKLTKSEIVRDSSAGKFMALIKAGGTKITLDKNGAITIPEYLTDYAGLTDASDIKFVEQKDWLEIWLQ